MQTLTKEEFEAKYGAEATAKISGVSNPAKRASRFSDALTDIKEAVTNTDRDFRQRGQNIANSFRSGMNGEQTPIETGLQAGAEVVLGLGDAAFNVASTPFKVAMSETEEKAVANTFGEILAPVADTYNSLSDRTKRNLAIPAALLEVVGFKAGSAAKNTVESSFKKADDVLAETRRLNPPRAGVTLPSIKQKIKDIRFEMSDIDPQVETALRRSNMDEVNTYFQQAKAAASDTRKETPLEIAGNKAEEAYNAIDQARSNAVQGKKAMLEAVGDQRVTGNTVNDVMSNGIQQMNERFGVKINADGSIEDVAGRFSKLDAADQKLVSDYFERLNSLGVAPTLREVDDFVDWAQSQLYKQTKTLSRLDAADDAVVKSLQSITGDLNSRLKVQVGDGYGDVNARISQLIEMQDELSRALGADARKGGGLMKRLFSPTGGQTREMFDQIYRETGIDLDKEANLARFAMTSAGDARQKSLLKQLDAQLETAAEIDLTKPLSIIKFIRERADLDDQELANEIIRRANAERSSGVSKPQTKSVQQMPQQEQIPDTPQ